MDKCGQKGTKIVIASLRGIFDASPMPPTILATMGGNIGYFAGALSISP